jgi:hypothetical protein
MQHGMQKELRIGTWNVLTLYKGRSFKTTWKSAAGLRPKLRWLDDVLEDLKILKVTAWWKKAQDRDSWKAAIKAAKAHKGLQCQIRRSWSRLTGAFYHNFAVNVLPEQSSWKMYLYEYKIMFHAWWGSDSFPHLC